MNITTMKQRYEDAVPIDTLVEHPDNVRLGDEDIIDASMEEHGFFGAVLVQVSTHHIIAGNHRTRVARKRGETTIPVIWLDVDDDQATRIMLMDNRSNDVAGYDESRLLNLLSDLDMTDRGLVGTGYHSEDIALLQALLAGDAALLDQLDGDLGRPMLGDVAFRIVVDCEDEGHQAALIERLTEEGLSVRAVFN